MTKWLDQYRNPVLIAILVLFLLLMLFYFFYIRPLAAEEDMKMDELTRIEEDLLFYQQELTKLELGKFTEEQRLLLEGSIPTRPNVEEIIKELEKTELETNIVIESIGVSIHPNELVMGANEQPEANGEENVTPTESNPVQDPDFIAWEHILPNETLELVKDRLLEIKDIAVSYVQLAINVNGEPEDVHQFVDQLEQLKRVIHIQSYDYTINEEKGNRLEGIITIRGFYSEDFADFITDESNFALDYDFDPEKLNRYIEREGEDPAEESEAFINVPTETASSSSNDNNENGSADETVTPRNNANNEIDSREAPVPEFSPLVQYRTPEREPNIDAPEFYVVQTGAYISTVYLNMVIKKQLDNHIYPRVIEDKFSYVYTATNTHKAAAEEKAKALTKQGFPSYAKTLPHRLTKEEIEALLPEAVDVINAVSEIYTNGRNSEKEMTEAQKNAVKSKMNAYQDKVMLVLEQSGKERRKLELQQTMAVLSQIESILLKDQMKVTPDSISQSEALLLDFILSLNGYVPVDSKGQ